MDGPGIDQKIRFGYYKASQKLGKDFSLYRSATPIDPLDSGNLVGSVKAVLTQKWDWMTANRPGNAIWFVLTDGRESSGDFNVREGDYLVELGTYFILAKQYQMPMLAVECNYTVTIVRPYQSIDDGGQGYAGYEFDGSTVIFQNVPGSILLKGTGHKPKTDLPTDDNDSEWIALLPNISAVDIKTDDILSATAIKVSSVNERFQVIHSEATDFGWRLTLKQVVLGG